MIPDLSRVDLEELIASPLGQAISRILAERDDTERYAAHGSSPVIERADERYGADSDDDPLRDIR